MPPPHLLREVPPPPRFLDVLPLGIDLGERDGHRLVLLAIERWDGWADLRFARVDVGATRPLPRRVPPAAAWKLRCDGEAMEVLDAVGRGDRSFSNGEVRFRPSPPNGAKVEVVVEVVAGAAPLVARFTVPTANA